jgi:tight adherence protein C
VSALLVATLAVAFGLFVCVSAMPIGRPPLAVRLREFDVDLRVAERGRGRAPGALRIASWEPLDALLRPLVEDLVRPLRGLLASTGLLRRDLHTELLLLDGKADIGGFVGKQLVVATIIASWPTLVSLILQLPIGLLTIVLSLVGVVVGLLLPYAALEERWRARRRRIQAELPQVINLVALSLGLLGLEGAIHRVAESCGGLLGAEFRRVHEELSLDLDRGLKGALRGMAERNDVPELSGLCNLLSGSAEQGLRLQEALGTMASTIRERRANALLAEGGKGSLKMLFPMALVIMPVTLAVVIVPGISALRGLGGP